MHDDAPGRRALHQVAVTPEPRVVLEVRRPVAREVGVADEAQRHRRQRLAAHQLARPTHDLLTVLVEHGQVDAEPGALDLPRVHRQGGHAEHEAAHDVGAARDAREVNVALHRLVDVAEAVGREGRAGRGQRLHRAEVEAGARSAALGLERVEVAGAGAEERHPVTFDQLEGALQVRVGGRAVVEHQRRAPRQRRDQPVPHHPAAGREVEGPVARPDVAVQQVLLGVRQKGAARAVHQRLGRARRAGGVEDVERVVEGQLLELRLGLLARRASHELLPGDDLGRLWRGRTGVREGDRPAGRRAEGSGEAVDGGRGVEPLPAVAVGRGREQQLRLELREASGCGVGAEVGRAGGEHRPQAGAGQQQDDRLGDVGGERRHGVPAAHPGGAQPALHGRHLAAQLAEAELGRLAALDDADDRGLVGIAQGIGVEQRPGVVERGSLEPAGERHRVGRARADGLTGQREPGEAGQQRPEALRLRDAPGVKGVVVG